MIEYPFVERVREQLKVKKENLNWLLGEIDKSQSWFFGIKSMFDLQLKLIMEFSRILEFDFLQDYYKWNNAELPVLNEPASRYEKEPEMTVQVTVKGPVKTFTKNLGKFLDAMAEEGEKAGLKVG